MPAYTAPDGTELAYHESGSGAPLVCLPGGPMQDSGYLGELGGLPAHRRLVMADPRGTGGSATPQDPASYRCDRLVGDLEALRVHLGLDRMDLLAHCAGANLAILYAARHPGRIRNLVLVTPSTFAAGIFPTGQARMEVARLRAGEPWFGPAFAALESMVAGGAADRDAVQPFFYGRWDATARAHVAAQAGRRNEEAAAVYGAEGAYDPQATRAALATFGAPTLVLAGEVDLNSIPSAVAELAGLFPRAEFAVLPGAGHFPWLDDPGRLVTAITTFLG
ncbi:alpha/beta fold hydrolase [Nonomuraea zeae]|uniref:Alpha/beta hydrolase n=1 Tax=Nonomuraea zeae TaxID=1642303 RepID=A0A5S4GKE3_9ACTN|nr:alpha/beta hydrolase [Nonomuraea zeae]TMR33071.1 alpha/beta hydrolase [Nonomuraea zeae]